MTDYGCISVFNPLISVKEGWILFMQSVIRKTNRKGARYSQSLNRVRSVEQKLTLFENV